MAEDEPVPATVDPARRAEDEALLSRFLRGRDAPCPTCRYNLRDLAGDRCPECGERLTLGVNVKEKRTAALLTGLIGLAAGAGMNGLLIIFAFIVVFIRGYPAGEFSSFAQVNGVGLVVEGAALFAWLKRWREIQGLSSGRRWAWAWAAWSLTLANVVWFTFQVK